MKPFELFMASMHAIFAINAQFPMRAFTNTIGPPPREGRTVAEYCLAGTSVALATVLSFDRETQSQQKRANTVLESQTIRNCLCVLRG